MLKYCNRYTPSILYQTLKPIDLRDSGASEEFLGNGILGELSIAQIL